MSKYGTLSRKRGNAQWFLQRTLQEHDRSMDHPWMKMIYCQSFTVSQYCEWLARNWAVFKAFEQYDDAEILGPVRDAKLLRTAALEADLAQLAGAEWRSKAEAMVRSSPATAKYLEHFEEDAAHPTLLLAHHFLQYNGVLSGGAYLGEMVSKKLCVPHGAPGVRFYAFDNVEPGKGPARVQQYLRDFDTIEVADEDCEKLLAAMKRVYADTEALMAEVFELNPVEGVSYAAAKEGENAAPAPVALSEQLELSLAELHGFTGADGGRILMCLAGELLDVSAGRDLYGPSGGYSLLAGHDVTRCLATMSLEPSELDDLSWEPDNGEDESALNQWREKLKAKYPVAGRLRPSKAEAAAAEPSKAGLRQRTAAAPAPSPAAAAPAAAAGGEAQRCPISGKEGAGCPMAFMGIGAKGPAASQAGASKAAGSTSAKPAATSGFMKGKSLVASVEKTSESSSGESFLYRLCPLHWDEQTIKVLLFVAAVSWASGVFVGWNLRRQLRP